MRSWQRSFLGVVFVSTVMGSYALAAPPADRNPNSPGLGWAYGKEKGDSGGYNRGAPGPLAGAGLPFLIVAGGYVLWRRYRNRDMAK
ncbi:hypothetical protein [Microvirga puerhi]|uniref:Uncharacterized protein n=1 Tax=Microvirga puerhi TaxID=2876078 RepID=A0ABS7VK17_9HYPH|nr:hypothetical protein [Microvirga puerhi]MBZ6075874.1 hypothetical protein [Microvirga puerhi]